MDILICRIKYPNDPTNNLVPHQHFVGSFYEDQIILYTISSMQGKDKRIYVNKGFDLNPDYYFLKGDELKSSNLRMPSFIDCTKSYKIPLNNKIDITLLDNRKIPKDLRNKIESKIQEVKRANKHREYLISTEEFLIYNNKCKI